MTWTVSGLDSAIKEWARSGSSMTIASFSAVSHEWAADLREHGPFDPHYGNVVFVDALGREVVAVVQVLSGTGSSPLMIEMVANPRRNGSS